MEAASRIIDTVKSFRVCFYAPAVSGMPVHLLLSPQETRLSALRPPSEFFDHQRISRPADLNQATSVSHIRTSKQQETAKHITAV
jgi:hypothetical protein